MTVRSRMLLSFGAMVAITALSAGAGWWYAGQAAHTTQTLVKQDIAELDLAASAANQLLLARAANKQFLIDHDMEGAARVPEHIAKVEHYLTRLAEVTPNPEHGKAARHALTFAANYLENFQQVVALWQKRGLTHEEGLEGKLREAVHNIESQVKSRKLDALTVIMLMCRRHEKDYLLRGDPKYLDKLRNRIAEFEQLATTMNLSAQEKVDYDKLWQTYFNSFAAIVEIDTQIAEATLQLQNAANDLNALAEGINQASQKSINENSQTIAASLTHAQSILLIILLAAVVAGISIALFATSTITRPLARMLHRVQQITKGDGDLSKRIDVQGKDELAELGHGINEFIEKLHDIINAVSMMTAELATASTELSANSEQMADGMEEQSQQVNHIVQAIDQLGVAVNEVAGRCTDAVNDARRSGELAQQGGQVVRDTIEGMNAIRAAVHESSQSVTSLGKRGEQIGTIIEVINEIAEQTNLLALNAAIESARAGEHGRGFAVVADEVRKLADRTTKATEEIGESIKAIQEETATAVTRMGTGTTRVETGATRAAEAGVSLDQIVASAENVGGMIQSIAAAAEQQAASTDEIRQNVDGVAMVAQRTTEAARESAQTVASVSQRAEELNRMIEKTGFQTGSA